MNYVCITRCLLNGRLYLENEILNWPEGEDKPPHHFQPVEKVEQEKKEKAEQVQSEEDEVKAELNALGKQFDKRWGLSKLRHLLTITKKGA